MSQIQQILVDASVLIALINQQDQFHEIAQKWIKKIHQINTEQMLFQLVLLSPTAIEVNTKIRKLKKNNKFTPAKSFEASGQMNYPIDQNFLNKVQELEIYDEFLEKLGSQDAVYAAVAFIEQIPLVTLDADFRKVSDKIKIECLLPPAQF